MFGDKSVDAGVVSTNQEARPPRKTKPGFDLTPAEWASLSRFGCGEWIPEAQIDRLQTLGLVEKVFGQALLTRLGRTTIGVKG